MSANNISEGTPRGPSQPRTAGHSVDGELSLQVRADLADVKVIVVRHKVRHEDVLLVDVAPQDCDILADARVLWGSAFTQ